MQIPKKLLIKFQQYSIVILSGQLVLLDYTSDHSLLYIRPDSKSTMDALIADLLKMISINIRVN